MDEKFLNVDIHFVYAHISLDKITALEYQELLDGLKAGNVFEFDYSTNYAYQSVKYLINPALVTHVAVKDWTAF